MHGHAPASPPAPGNAAFSRTPHQPTRSRFPLILSIALGVLALTAAFVAFKGWIPEPRQDKDERFFWPAALELTSSWWPSTDQLRNSTVPTTPLSLLILGWSDRLTHTGIVGARITNALASLATILLIATARRRSTSPSPPPSPETEPLRPTLSALGLLACPYLAGMGVLVYTDAISVLFVTLGLWLHLRHRAIAGAVAFALAIASRQYMVVFPLGLAIWEIAHAFRPRADAANSPARLQPTAILAPAAAAATLAGWFWLYGGPAPHLAIETFKFHTAAAGAFEPQHGLYALACIGAYFVVVEAVLFRRIDWLFDVPKWVWLAAAAALAACFLAFPPLQSATGITPTMGYLDIAARKVLPDWARMAAYWSLAVLAIARVVRSGPALTMLLCHALIMTKASLAWDKYALPMLAVLWLLTSAGVLNGRADSASTRPAPQPAP